MAQFESLIAANKAKSAVLIGLFVLLYTALFFVLVMAVLARVYGWAIVHDGAALLMALLGCHIVAVGLAAACCVGGPGLVISAVGARPVLRLEDEVLYDVVDEMAIAAGIQSPAVYMIDSSAMNALATGLGPRKAAIIVTRGLRDGLTRDQLQAVVGHEMARIRDYDIQLMTLVAGLLGIVVLLAEFVKTLFDSKERTPVLVGVLLAPLAVPVLLAAPALGRLIQLGVSRERQFLADAAAAQLTRYPEALAGALEAMASAAAPFIANRAVAPLFTIRPASYDGAWEKADDGSVWSSHPPIEERVRRLHSIGNIEG
ncbi:MAG: M48 family metalloprotease [Planctomycetota bacterium]|nr:M48 family metalloprotease [Planctomycetota bacterium]